MSEEIIYYATGRRKSSVAKTWIKPGTGNVIINNRPIAEYFRLETSKGLLLQPFVITNTADAYDVKVSVRGGGISGQVGAIRHGITRALLQVSPDFRKPLKKAGFITRDARIKERKKYGQKAARARFQFSKR